jgi:hypothetical protein
MPQAQDGMPPQHLRAGINHDGAHLFAAFALVAMHRTLRAHRFLRAEMAALQPHLGVIQKLPARRAQTGRRLMPVATENLQHRRHRPPFTGEPHLRKIVLHEDSLAEAKAASIDANQLSLILVGRASPRAMVAVCKDRLARTLAPPEPRPSPVDCRIYFCGKVV